jgi:predicted membrane protein
MGNRRHFVLGGILILIGVFVLLENLLDISLWAYCLPIGMILLGAWLLYRPRMVASGTEVTLHPLGDIKRSGTWDATNEEIWMFVGNTKLDFTEADLAFGETKYDIFCFVGDIDLVFPQDVGYQIASTAFLNSSKVQGKKEDVFLSTYRQSSEGYSEAERKVQVEILSFVSDLDIKLA